MLRYTNCWGGHRKKLPCYASTYHADREPDGLSSPEAYADFAEQCFEMGYPGFKIHSWGEVDIEREIATVRAVGGARRRKNGANDRSLLRLRHLRRHSSRRKSMRRIRLLLV